jgi:hypothetical protein
MAKHFGIKWLGKAMWSWMINAGTWMLMFTNFVPISLLVTLELVKLF